MSTKRKKINFDAQQKVAEVEYKKNARRFSRKRRITRQIRIENGRYIKVAKLAEDVKKPLSRALDSVVDAYFRNSSKL